VSPLPASSGLEPLSSCSSWEARVDDRLVVELDLLVAVLENDVVDERAGIGARQDERDLADDAVHDGRRLLEETVGVDGERLDVVVLDELPGGSGLVRLVEEPVAVDAVVPVLELEVAENVLGIVVLMLPHHRDLHPVLVLERLGGDGATVGALDAELRDVATEVGLRLHCHFDSPFVVFTSWLTPELSASPLLWQAPSSADAICFFRPATLSEDAPSFALDPPFLESLPLWPWS
jgi:hypothetical protein